MRRLRIGVWALAALTCARLAAGQAFDPAYRFRTIRTPHFAIHFHQGEEGTASRLAAIAEETWLALQRALATAPPRSTDVILVDQTDSANGWATPVPRDTIMVTATWPGGVDFIGSTDDWLRVAFTHEFTHIAHLDESRSWARAVRTVFGRVPVAFPNLLMPIWQIEGLATFEESAISGEGRLHAGDFRAIVDEAALAGRLEPMDRVNGGLIRWPAGYAAYAYGLAFNAYLADRFGDAATARLASETAGALPYVWPRAFSRVYGESLDALWRDFDRHLQDSAASATARARQTAAATDDAVRLTHDGFIASGPRIAPPLCAACAAQVVYASVTPDAFPALASVGLDDGRPAVRLTDRATGETSGVSRNAVYFDAADVHRNAGVYPDIVRLDRHDGRTRSVTKDARVSDPDLSPDGATIIATHARADRRELVLLPATAAAPVGPNGLTVVASASETQFKAPRWSPDGQSIAVERHRLGAYPEIVVVTLATREIRVVASTPRVRWVTPTWRPDGRTIVAAADIGEGVFNLYEVPLDGGPAHALTHTTGGATWPDITPDGLTIVFAGYTPDGFDIFRAPYRVDRGHAVDAVTSDDAHVPAATVPLAATAYAPWSMLAPTSWSPTIDSSNGAWRAGALVAGADVLGYHSYAFSPTWIVTQPADTPASSTPDVSASYAYTRWPVQPWVAITRTTSFFGGVPDASGAPVVATEHERDFETGVAAVRARVRQSQVARLSYWRATADMRVSGRVAAIDRSSMRAAWAIATARTYGYSISPEHGLVAGATTEFIRRVFGADADATVWTGDVRAYLPGAARHHVVALRVAAGASRGDANTERVFLLGGGSPAPTPIDYGSEAFGLLRGFASDAFAGTHVVVLNAEYRWPIRAVERGAGSWPIFVRTLSAAAIVDAGNAWVDQFVAANRKVAAGLEMSADVVLGYSLPLTIAGGAAWGHDGSERLPDGWRGYVRIGRAF